MKLTRPLPAVGDRIQLTYPGENPNNWRGTSRFRCMRSASGLAEELIKKDLEENPVKMAQLKTLVDESWAKMLHLDEPEKREKLTEKVGTAIHNSLFGRTY